MEIVEMAQAHLQTVQQSINELENQKKLIDQEIARLLDYVKAGQEALDRNRG
jgi:hypothetical protein